MLPLASGARLGTVTSKLWSADAPCGSVAVAVTVAVPALAAVIVTVLPDHVTLATVDADDEAEYVSASPSGSLKYCERSTVASSPACTVCAGMFPRASGTRLGTVT